MGNCRSKTHHIKDHEDINPTKMDIPLIKVDDVVMIVTSDKQTQTGEKKICGNQKWDEIVKEVNKRNSVIEES